MKTDPAIQRTRDARQRISSSVGDDPARMVEYYIKIQGRFAARLRHGASHAPADDAPAEHQLPADAHGEARR
jgi:hypothetical protein